MDTPHNQPKEAIAIIGMACRFPGGAHTPEQFFENLEAGKSAWSEFPSDRLNIDGFYHPSPQRHDSFPIKGAHFLTGNIAAFDAEFFSMSTAESNSTDVQQRILLEVAYEAVENAGIPKETVAGSDTSVYIGSFVKDYEQVSMRDSQYLAPDCATGNGIAIMSNRISYFFDIRGPSMTIDTGCSASLVCIHQAVQSLLNGESSMAMAGGAGMILTPSTIMPMVSLGFLSNDGRCYTFDSRANGYGRGEGVGIVVLKRLSDAIRDNDTIRGVIRGTSTNQDGRTSGITMPSPEAQVINIRKCYASAGLDADQTMFVECHGTGTQAGDPRELKAISDALCNERPADKPLLVGSVKTNIGHLEGSAGVAGVIKAVMTIENGMIPRHINFQSWNPDIDNRRLKVDIPFDNTPWPSHGVRRISVNSFGFGGSNAHAIIDDAAHYLAKEMRVSAHHNTSSTLEEVLDANADLSANPPTGQQLPAPPYLFVFSANDQGGVARIADAHLSYLADGGLQVSDMRDYAYTLFSRRSKLQYRSFAVARNQDELAPQLAAVKRFQPLRWQKSRALNLAFVFGGQGAQWSKMGTDLRAFQPFRDSLVESSTLLKELDPDFDLLVAMLEDGSEGSSPRINEPIYAQPATTAVQIALVDLLTACGVKPTAVLGHSSGEIAAAYAADMISRVEAMTIAFFRGKAASHVQLKGSMLAVNISPSGVQRYLGATRDGSVCVACVNSPESVTLSGNTNSIMQIRASLDKDGITNKVLVVNTAYHSHHMHTVSDEYQDMLSRHLPEPAAKHLGPAPAMFSSVTGRRVSQDELSPSYWVNNMVSPVEFQRAVLSMLSAEKAVLPDVLLEVSPQSVLRQALSEIVGRKGAFPHFPMMSRKNDGAAAALTALGELWARGLTINLDWLHQGPSHGKPKCLVDLPTYPWDHSKTYWHESHLSKAHRFRKFGSHDLLGAMTADSITPQEPRWRGFIDIKENPWIEHHRIQKKIMYPAAGMVVMAVEAAKQVVDRAAGSPSHILDFEISNFKIEEPLIIPQGETRLEYNFNATRIEESTTGGVSTWRYSFTIYSILDTSSTPPYQHTTNARGFFIVRFSPRGLGETNGATRHIGLAEALISRGANIFTPSDYSNGMSPLAFYERLNIIGLNYGRLFRNIAQMCPPKDIPWSESTKCCWTRLQIPNTQAIMPEEYETPSTMHPATLDAMFQSLFVLADEPMVPHFIESIRISADAPQGAGTGFLGYSEAKRKGAREAISDMVMWHEKYILRPMVTIRGLKVITMANRHKTIPDFLPDNRNLCSQIVWKEDVHSGRGIGEVSGPRTLETMIDLMGHRFPGLRVLQVGGEPSVASFVLRILGSDPTPRLCSYVFLDDTALVFQLADGAAANNLRPLISYEKLVDKFNLPDVLKQQKFDIVLADSRVGIDPGVLIQILKPTGILAFTHKYDEANGASDQDGVVSGHFQHAANEPLWAPSSWYSLPQARPAEMSGESVILLTEDDDFSLDLGAPSMIEALASRLQSTCVGLAVKSMGLTEFRDMLLQETGEGLDAFVISLLELNGSNGVVYHLEAENYGMLQTLFQRTNKGLLWVTAGAQMDTQLPTQSPFLGWVRTVRSEEPDRQIVCLDLEVVDPEKRKRVEDSYSKAAIDDAVSAVCDVFFRSFASTTTLATRDVEFAQRGGQPHVPRLEPLTETNKIIEEGLDQEYTVQEVYSEDSEPLTLVRGASGIFEDVYFKEDPDNRRALRPREVLIDVEKCCVIPDGLDAETSESRNAGYLTDVWGTVVQVGTAVTRLKPGKRVIVLGCGAVATRFITHQCFVWNEQRNRDYLTYPPTCLVTASCCLSSLTPGLKVLIHGAAGPYGQAAIRMALHRRGKVFAVVSGDDQRRALVDGRILPDDRIFDADDGLPEKVASVCERGGMDIIFNPTADHRDMDFRMIKPYGQVVHLAIPGAALAPEFPAARHCFQFNTFDFGGLLERSPAQVAEYYEVNRHLEGSHRYHPVLVNPYTFGNVQAAFKDIKAHPSNGVCVLRKSPDEMLSLVRVPRDSYLAPRLSWSSTYVVAGGLGGLGLDVIKWLVDHGARHVTILSRSTNHGQTAQNHLNSLRERGVQITVIAVDICDWDSCSDAFRSISSDHTIAGVIQAAAVIKDGIYRNLTYDDWKAVTRVKTVGSYNLHLATLRCRPLDFFIFLSSAAGIIGNPGQSSYNAGNAFCDALARNRSACGLHSVSIDLGPVLGAGMVAADEALWDQLRAGGFIGVRLEDFHLVLERAVAGTRATTRSATTAQALCPPQVVMGVGTGGLVRQNNTTNAFWTRTALFSYLNMVDLPPGTPSLSDPEQSSNGFSETLIPDLQAVSSRSEAASLLLPYFVMALGQVMGKNYMEIDPDSVLDDHGPDSLRMKDLLDWVYAVTGVKVTGVNQMPLRSICELIADLGGFGSDD